MKKALMITYDFPPMRTSGVYRPVKFVKYLKNYGWQATILTVKNPHRIAEDKNLLKEVPKECKIYRAYSFEPTKLEDRIYQTICSTPRKKKLQFAGVKNLVKRSFLSPLNAFVHNWIYIPDTKIGWFPFALFSALKLIKKENFDVIYTTSSPHTCQLVGLSIKLLTQKPWVVDLRDNWVVGYSELYKHKLRVRIEEYLLKRILARADQVITMCEGNARDLIEKFDFPDGFKYHAITNGYDRDDWERLETILDPKANEKFILTHIGTLYAKTSGEFFPAISELLKEKKELEDVLQVNLVGYVGDEDLALIKKLGLEKNVRLLGFRVHSEAIKSMLNSNVLLLFLGEIKTSQQQFPGKFFEYLLAKKPILTLGKEGEIAQALYKSKAGLLVHPKDKEKIKEVILGLLMRKKRGELNIFPDPEYIQRFDYKNLTLRFAQVLDKACSKHIVTCPVIGTSQVAIPFRL
jgi:glycosyltransferase involved in cell wall biosynthesis